VSVRCCRSIPFSRPACGALRRAPHAGRLNAIAFLFALLIIHLLSSGVHAGVVETRDGKTITGAVTLETSTSVSLTAGGATTKYPLADLARVELGPDSTPGDAQPTTAGGWQSQDVGPVHAPGSITAADGSYTLKASGWGVWSGVDSFHFAYQLLDGDGQLTARVTQVGGEAPRMSAGVMLRASLEPSAPFTAAMLEPSGQVRLKSRPRPKQDATPDENDAAKPVAWVRLTRAGDTITAYGSKDGQFWENLGSREMKLPAKVYVGLAGSTLANVAVGQVTYDHLSLVHGAPDITPPVPSPLPPTGVVMTDGTATIGRAVTLNSDSLTLTHRGVAKTYPAKQAAWILLQPAPAAFEKLIAAKPAGVLLANGDYFEGDITAIVDDKITANNVIFGPKSFETKDAVAVVMRPPTMWAGYHVRTKTGDVISGPTLQLDGDSLTLGGTKVRLNEVTEIFPPKL